MLTGISILALQIAVARLGGDLSPGMQLIYASNGNEQPPWIVDSVATNMALMPGADCARILLRRAAAQPPNDSRLCVARDTLLSWNAQRNVWSVLRPLGAHMSLVQPRANGDTVRYTTDAWSEDTISGVRVPVLTTTVLTVDSLGRPKRRLRERYAPTLATATGGTFEVPDASAPGGWRAEQTFELRRLLPSAR